MARKFNEKRRRHPLHIIDDHSRFNLCCQAQYTETFIDFFDPAKFRIDKAAEIDYNRPNKKMSMRE